MRGGYWDIHNHILPGVDDGSSCMEETRDLLEEEYRQGTRHIVFTPHYRPNMFDVPSDERQRAYRDTCAKFAEDFPDMRFYLGCEMHVGKQLFTDLHDPRCRMAGTRTVLLEFDNNSSFETMRSVTARAVREGYCPLIAHVERYEAFYTDPEMRIRMLQMAGAWIQINAGSVTGAWGRVEKRFCRELLTEGLADVIASDAHNLTSRPVLLEKCRRQVEKICGHEAVGMLFAGNPARLLHYAQNRV